jgi:hypothetical protein
VVELSNDDDRKFIGTQIQWSMQELEDLYMFAHRLGAPEVCDMVVDRWYEEMHRPTKRLLCTAEGGITHFDILGFSAAFLNYVCQDDEFMFDFFTDILIMKGEDGMRVLKAFGLNAWHNDVKLMLIAKLETGEVPPVSKNDMGAVCSTYHHHGTEHGYYKSKVPFEPLVFDPELHEISVSKPVVKRSKRHEQGEYISSSDPSDSSDDEELNYVGIELDSEYCKTRELFKDAPSHYEHHTDAYTCVRPKPKIAARTPTVLLDGMGRPLYEDDALNVGKKNEGDDVVRTKWDIVFRKMKEFSDCGYSFKDILVPEKYRTRPDAETEQSGVTVGDEDVEMSGEEVECDDD